MYLIVLCYVLHFPTTIEAECRVVYARSAHLAATAFIAATPEVTKQWAIVWHTVDGDLAVVHYEQDADEE
jgi:hypothetical protein